MSEDVERCHGRSPARCSDDGRQPFRIVPDNPGRKIERIRPGAAD